MTDLKAPRRRRVGGLPVRKITVSLSAPAVEAAYADMEARGIPTISEYLDRLVMERSTDNDLKALVEEKLGGVPITAEERAWARGAFGLE
jgi:hypothetical protein